jgi:enamine deaminase RidA (YjgF/YER057c/UK114 family)
MRRTVLLALASLAGCASLDRPPCSAAGEITRTYASPSAMFARTVLIPHGYETIRLPGMIADPVSPAADGRPAAYGDTEQQTESVLAKIRSTLAEVGATEADVVAATVYLVAPAPGGTMDFAGMNRAYARHFGSPEQPNRPVRSTVQVAGLAAPGLLVEIEVTAARKPR